MQASTPTESPIINNPIINSPIVNNPIISSPIISTDEQEEFQDFNPACAAGVPAGARMFYFKFVAIMFAVGGGAMYGLYKLCESMGWFN